TTASSSNTQNVAFVSAENTYNTNDVSTAYSVSSPSVLKSQKEGSSSYTHEVIHSFFKNQSSASQLDYDDLKQINDDDIEEMDLKWQVAMISMRIKKFHKRTGRKLQFDTKDPVGFDKTKDDLKASVTIDGEDIDWSGYVEEDAQNYAMMAYSSSNSGSNNEVKSCSKACEESYARHCMMIKGTNLVILVYGSILSYENEVLLSGFMNKECDLENTLVNDRYAKGMHTVPPLMTRNYMPSGPDVEIDYSKFTYGLKQTSTDESNSKPSEYASCESDSSVET
nr:ribonuclease H-like domain-containing protein [Tanacetum cinerariifolium]